MAKVNVSSSFSLTLYMPVKLLSFLSFSVIFVYLFAFGFVVDLGLSACWMNGILLVGSDLYQTKSFKLM